MSRLKTAVLVLAPFLLAARPRAAAAENVLKVVDVLRQAEKASPDIQAALQRSESARHSVDVARGGYYPDLSLEAIYTGGLPGSSSPLGVTGLMGSPYRKGPAAGLVSRWSFLEFGRTEHDVRASEADWKASREEARVARLRLDESALRLYLDGVRYRSQRDTWVEVGRETETVAREVEDYVRTGQRSVVERMLVQDQVLEASATAAGYAESYRLALRRLGLATGRPEGTLACPDVSAVAEGEFDALAPGGTSPLVLAPQARAEAARERVSETAAKNYPQLVATASAGSLDQARLVEKTDYAAGVGFILPLFDGLRTTSEIDRARANERTREQEAAASRLALEDLDARYEQVLAASRARLSRLEEEKKLAEEALKLAKERYSSYQGTLVDVREALRNTARVRTDINDVRVEILLARGSRLLADGATVP